MFSKIKLASGLLFVLAAFCLLQLVTGGIGFWFLTSTHHDVGDLANVALVQVNAVNETTQHLMDARINLSRAGTRMVGGGAEPTAIVQHAREQLVLADKSFARFADAPKTSDENRAHATALAEKYKTLHTALGELAQYLDNNDVKSFMDQPTQSMQDAFLNEQHAFTQFGDAQSQASLDSIDSRLSMFRGVTVTELCSFL